MPINLTVEQQDLAEMLGGVWSGIAPGDDVWPSIRELGLTEIPFPEATGGADGTFRDLTVVMTGLGRTLGSAPYFSSVVMAGLALLEAADRDTREEVLPGIVSGARTAALVCGPGMAGSAIRGEASKVSSSRWRIIALSRAWSRERAAWRVGDVGKCPMANRICVPASAVVGKAPAATAACSAQPSSTASQSAGTKTSQPVASA